MKPILLLSAAVLVLSGPARALINTAQTPAQSCGPAYPADAKTPGTGCAVAAHTPTHKVFVADRERNRVLRFSAFESLNDGGTAEAVFGQANMTSSAAGSGMGQLSQPSALTVDNAGRLWIADSGNRRVVMIPNAHTAPSGSAATLWLGDGQAQADANSIAAPAGLVVDNTGALYVSDSTQHRVLRWNSAATKSSGALPSAVLGQSTTSTAAPNLTQWGMNTPLGLAVEGDGTAANPVVLYVADSENRRILRFQNADKLASGSPATGLHLQFDYTSSWFQGWGKPQALAMRPDGTLIWGAKGYDAQWGRSVIFLIQSARTGHQTQFMNSMDGTSWSFPSALVSGGAPDAGALAVDGDGHLWIGDHSVPRIVHYDMNQEEVTNALGLPLSLAPDRFQPAGMALDPVSGKIFVSDTWRHRVLRYADATAFHTGSAPEAVLGQNDLSGTAPGSALHQMWRPRGLACDGSGRLWVVDTDNHRVLRFDGAGSLASGSAASGFLGGRIKSKDDPIFGFAYSHNYPDSMFFPASVAVGAGGRLWVADSAQHRVLRFDNAASLPNAAPASRVIGQAAFATEFTDTDPPPGGGSDGLNYPEDLCEDADGILWVADTGNNRVLGFHPQTLNQNGPDALWVFGQGDFAGTAAGSGITGLRHPTAVSVTAGRLYIADHLNHRVVWINNPARGLPGQAFGGVLGQSTFSQNAPRTDSSGLHFPVSLATHNGSLWVADAGNLRVQQYQALLPQITSATVHPATQKFRIHFTSVPGQLYEIQQSTDLLTWTKAGEVQGNLLINATTWYSPETVSAVSRFYRVAVP